MTPRECSALANLGRVLAFAYDDRHKQWREAVLVNRFCPLANPARFAFGERAAGAFRV